MVKSGEVLAGRELDDAGTGDLVDDSLGNTGGGRTDDGADALAQEAVVDWVAMSVLVSPESRWMTWTGLPSTPPASLISLMPRLTPAISGGPRNASDPVVGRSDPIFSGVAVVVVDGGTAPVAVAVLAAPAVALGAGQAMPAAAAVRCVALGVEVPPQAVARRATPMPSAVSLATRGAAWGSEIIDNLLDRKVRTAFDANDQVFLI